MAKKRTRGPAGTSRVQPSRAELKALERRAPAATSTAVRGPTAETAAAAPVSAPRDAAAARGVLPPRVSRVGAGVPTLSREQELAYVRGDLRRMTILALAMVAIMVALVFLLPYIVR
jgi:hypothetical protein